MSEDKNFKQVGPIDYEITLNGRTRAIRAPFAVTEAVFQSFISAGGVIDPVTGQVQQDILQLISSFKEVGNILLTERDEDGNTVKEGNCANLGAEDVISLFQLATHLVESFIRTLSQMKNPQTQPEDEKEAKAKTKKA